MKMESATLCLLSALLVAVNSDCPTWFVATSNETSAGHDEDCKCGASVHGIVLCDHNTKQVDIRNGWCMTDLNWSRQSHDEGSSLTGTVVVGECPYLLAHNATSRAYSSLPSDPANLTNTMCGRYHRTGLLCSQCVEGYGPAVYAYDFHCSKCSDMSTAAAVALYLLLESLPSVLLFIIVMLLNINIMSGPMFGYIIFCQNFIIFPSICVASYFVSTFSTEYY